MSPDGLLLACSPQPLPQELPVRLQRDLQHSRVCLTNEMTVWRTVRQIPALCGRDSWFHFFRLWLLSCTFIWVALSLLYLEWEFWHPRIFISVEIRFLLTLLIVFDSIYFFGAACGFALPFLKLTILWWHGFVLFYLTSRKEYRRLICVLVLEAFGLRLQ